jgi:D-arabinose 1-dehydrogenase-like Zn-dependent alcohol dehydrogenase
MKAVAVLEYGGPLVFNDVPTPTISHDDILVRVKSTAVNHIDLVKASGKVRQILPIDLPWIPGHEFSGVVEQIGKDVAWLRRATPCSVSATWAPTRSFSLSSR